MKNSGLTSTKSHKLNTTQEPIDGQSVIIINRKGASGQIWRAHCPQIEASHEINVFISVFRWIQDHIWQPFINIWNTFISETAIRLVTVSLLGKS